MTTGAELTPQPLDYDTLLEDLGGHEPSLRDMLEVLLRSTAECSALIGVTFAARDASGLASSAHKLRGALVAFGAKPAAAAAANLEALGRSSDFGRAPQVMRDLDRELDRLRRAVAARTSTREESER